MMVNIQVRKKVIKMNDQQIEQLLSLEDNENKSKNKKGRKKKLVPLVVLEV